MKESVQTVTIGCKLPHGLHLDLMTKDQGLIRKTVKGNNSSAVFGGFGLTDGIPKDFWEEWLRQNAALDPVKKGLIWAYPTREGAEKKGLEEAEKRHGMTQIDPKGDPRTPKNVRPADEKDE